ncbi:FAD-dependent oxidoreductase [Amycolatopsis sp. CA-126428]|uniref:FAD-dependent oxidoreductase n=1 Tax=Amycolatopsis sp. CA-126428 TaxID=2073158 RepID=UPI0011B0AE8F|nr:FAD-binding protein [Amycolatopsis sp. CA-126428]
MAADCATDVPGLFAAGDVASRVPVVGAISGGGSPNSAWAVSSGTWAGRAAVRHAHGTAAAPLRPIGRAGIRPSGRRAAVDTTAVIDVVREELNAYDKNMFRDEAGLRSSLSTLDTLWTEVEATLTGEGRDAVTARETASLVAMGRWVKEAALRRRESLGMHWRTDDPTWQEAAA